MILKYIITDNRLIKENPTDYPVHLQDNVFLEFDDEDGLINGKSYAYIKVHDVVKRVKIKKENGRCFCELPLFVTHQTFFKLKVVVFVEDNLKMVTNELIIPIRVSDYLDWNRGLAHSFSKKNVMVADAIYDNSMNRYDGLWKYPNIPYHVRNA